MFPQHCQIPCLTKHQHFRALTEELTEAVDDANATTAGKRLVKALQRKIEQALNPNLVQDEQRVREDEQRVARENQQRVVDNAPILTIPRITDAPPIMQSRNPTAKRRLHENPRIHRRVTRHNTPGGLPLITRRAKDTNNETQGLRRSLRIRPAIALSPSPVATPPKVTSRPIPSLARQRLVTRQALNVMTIQEQVATNAAFTPTALTPRGMTHRPMKFEHYANPMVHPITGETISSYKKMMHVPANAEVWQTAFGKDFGGMCQGDNKTGQKGTNAMFVMTHDEIAHALRAKRIFTYGNPVVDHRTQKEDPNRIRITAGGNLIKCDEEVSVRTADINTATLHWNSVISTIGARYMCLDIGNFYLTAALEYFEYMKMPLALFPAWIIEQYNLKELALNGYVHLKIRRAVWGLPQVGILANKRLRRKLAPFGYYKCVNTPGLWYHVSRPISFTLVVDDFGVKYVGKDHADHLIASIKCTYKKLTEDWTGSLYCGILLDWDYVGRTVDISMPGYIKKKLQEYQHSLPKRIQNCPYSPEPKRFGVDAQAPIETDETAVLDAKGIKRIQQIVGSILYYARAVDMTVLMALSSIAVEQTKATEKTLGHCLQLLDYLVSNSEAKVRYHASDMIMNIHSDASYLSETKARSRACGHFSWDGCQRMGSRSN